MALRSIAPSVPIIRSLNPATGEVLRTFTPHTDADIDCALEMAHSAFAEWRRTSFAARSRLMLRAAEILERRKSDFARTMTLEMGKLLREAVAEAEKCARGCRFYAENAERFLADEPHRSSATTSFVRYQPLGTVLAIMPWNFPFWQLFRFAAPALMAGNVALLKHAQNVPQCALAIEQVFRAAGFPEGVLQALLIGIEPVPRILADPRVAAVTLTGSVRAGASVAANAGKHIKKSVLELGGSDPFIVMPSADFERAVDVAVKARVINNGQSCIAAKRFIVHEQIADKFEQRFVEKMKSLKVGDPMLDSTDVGPLQSEEARDALAEQVERSVKVGARVLCGGRVIPGPGWFYEPTVLTDIPDGAPAACDELFGPVASLFRARDLDDALRIANDTQFGLGASLWSNDQAERREFIERIESGLAFINGMVASDPPIPFGGIKNSGYGRELGHHGIREFVNVKTVCIFEDEPRKTTTE